MIDFKFLTQSNTVRPNSNNNIIIHLDNGEIWRFNEQLDHGINRLQYGPNCTIKQFRWSHNYDHEEILGEQYRSNTEYYHGPINEFFTYYELRRNYPARISILPPVPVILRILCEGYELWDDSLIFSNHTAQVRIRYKKYIDRNL
jgi:hypothetical protein